MCNKERVELFVVFYNECSKTLAFEPSFFRIEGGKMEIYTIGEIDGHNFVMKALGDIELAEMHELGHRFVNVGYAFVNWNDGSVSDYYVNISCLNCETIEQLLDDECYTKIYTLHRGVFVIKVKVLDRDRNIKVTLSGEDANGNFGTLGAKTSTEKFARFLRGISGHEGDYAYCVREFANQIYC